MLNPSWIWPLLALLLVAACKRSVPPTADGVASDRPGSATTAQASTRTGPSASAHAQLQVPPPSASAAPSATTIPRVTAAAVAQPATPNKDAKGLPALCSLPPDSGRCLGLGYRYRHDAATGLCRPFVYGLCEGNANNFFTLAECQATCRGSQPNYDACQVASDCEIGPALLHPAASECCWSEAAERYELIAYAKRYAATLRVDCSATHCAAFPTVETPPTEEERARVPAGDPLQSNPALHVAVQTRKYFVPVCEHHECALLDIRESNLNACTRDSDCRLRDGAECCSGSDGRGIVAISKTGTLEHLSCAPGQRCPRETPLISHSLQAKCVERHCQVVAVRPSWRQLFGNGAPDAGF